MTPSATPTSPAARLAALPRSELAALHGRSLLTTRDLAVDEIHALLALAGVAAAADRAGIRLPLCPEELHLALFFDASTRTRSSWAGAAARLGARPMVVDGASTQVSHGETPEETGAMLGMNAHALGVRHDLILGEGQSFMRRARSGLDAYLEAIDWPRVVPLVNLQCDVDHPTQTLADLAWLSERFSGELAGRRVAVSWAYSPSYAKPLSVPQGLVTLLPRFGMEVVLAHPPGYDLVPEELEAAREAAGEGGGTFEVVGSMEEAFDGADAVYPKSWGPYDLMLERVAANRVGDRDRMAAIERAALERNRGHRDWICDEARMAATRDGGGLYLHCLPADIGAEVSPAVMERHRVDVARQANHKLWVILAFLAAAKVPGVVERIEEVLR